LLLLWTPGGALVKMLPAQITAIWSFTLHIDISMFWMATGSAVHWHFGWSQPCSVADPNMLCHWYQNQLGMTMHIMTVGWWITWWCTNSLCFVCVQSFLKDMAVKKVMAIVQLPHRGKFLGLITASSSSSPAQVPQKLIGLVLTLHINQQPKQQ